LLDFRFRGKHGRESGEENYSREVGAMLHWFRRLNRKRKLLLIWNAMFAALLAWLSVIIVTAPGFENGQKFGMVVAMWTFAALGFVFAWRAAK
jgi:hypothetical protein